MSDSSSLPVAVLYSFPGSCWASSARLALIEKGYGPDECTVKDVDLLAGANFSPEYLKINTAGTVPTLVVPQLATAIDNSVSTKFTALTSSQEILEFLDKSRSAESRGEAPARSLQPASIASKERDDALIALVHTKEADPNFLLLSIRDANEAKEKANGVVGKFVNGRKSALEKYLKEAEDGNERLANFYKEKLKAMESLSSILNGTSSEAYFTQSKTAYTNLGLVLKNLNVLLPREDRSGFISLADLHVGAWFARILSVIGAQKLDDVEGSFESLLKATDDLKKEDVENVKKWWTAMTTRASFQQIYKDGLF